MASFMIGMDPNGVYPAIVSTSANSEAGKVPALGDQCEDYQGNRYRFVSASTSITSYQAVKIFQSNNYAAALTETLGATGGAIGVAGVNGISSGSWGWVQIYGSCTVNALSTCSANSVLYCTATAGAVDDSGTTKIAGLIGITSITAAATMNAVLSTEAFSSL